jgi:hypothetical protein
MFYFDWSAIFLKVIAPCWWWPVSTGVITIRPISAVQVSNHRAHEALDTPLPRGSLFQSLTVGIPKSQMWCSMHFICILVYFSVHSSLLLRKHCRQLGKMKMALSAGFQTLSALHRLDAPCGCKALSWQIPKYAFRGKDSCLIYLSRSKQLQ